MVTGISVAWIMALTLCTSPRDCVRTVLPSDKHCEQTAKRLIEEHGGLGWYECKARITKHIDV